MLAARQRLLVGRARDGAGGAAIAPIGTVVLLPDPDFRRRVFRGVSHVGLSCVARWGGRMNRAIPDNAQRPGAYADVRLPPASHRRMASHQAARPLWVWRSARRYFGG